MVDQKAILAGIEQLGIKGEMVCIHTALKSFGFVEGGAETLIQSFLEADCTLLVPTFSYDFEVYPPIHLRPKRNGIGDYSDYEGKDYEDDGIFSPDYNVISKADMGVVPDTLLQNPNRTRGNNPLNSFSALGRHAETLTKNQSPENVYAPLQTLCQEKGYVLLMGVDLDHATIIHYAEQVAGRNLFVRWAYDLEGETIPVHTGSCSDGFNQLANQVKSIESNVTVGKSLWRCFPADQLVQLCQTAIQKNPEITHCHDPKCLRCQDAVLGGPIW